MNKYFIFCLFILKVSGAEQINKTPEERAKELLDQLTLEQKFDMIHGHEGLYQGNTPSINLTRPLVPQLNLEDGPQGVSDGVKNVTAFPSTLTVAASFDKSLLYLYGSAIGQEQIIKGTNVVLGPMVNLARNPVWGRNFEGFGEDTFLVGELAYQYINGVQDQGVMACVKHLALDNQETNERLVSINIDERVLYEVYLPQFQRAIEARVGAVMCSYNRVNQVYSCENDKMLNGYLKGRLNFSGWVMSDWGATQSSFPAAIAGLDQEMPSDDFFGKKLRQDFEDNKISIERINDMVYRIFVQMFKFGYFDRQNDGNLQKEARNEQRRFLAQQFSENSTVLLKNDLNILPIDISKIRKICILGDQANDTLILTGGGSGQVISDPISVPLYQIQDYLKDSDIEVLYGRTNDIERAQMLAQQSDLALIFIGVSSTEGQDRQNLSLTSDQNKLVSVVSNIQKRKQTVVVLNAPGAVLMPWVDQVRSILVSFLPGSQYGKAITNILFGLTNPSGKLPVTFPKYEKQVPANTPEQYPGVDNQVYYSEGFFIGYKWYEKQKEIPLYSFGYGMSYTQFQLLDFLIDQISSPFTLQIQVGVKNTGKVFGSEVIQLYIGMPEQLQEPIKQLKYFEKVALNPNQTRKIIFVINQYHLRYWSIQKQDYDTVIGDYTFYIGTSSNNIIFTQKCTLDLQIKCQNIM